MNSIQKMKLLENKKGLNEPLNFNSKIELILQN